MKHKSRLIVPVITLLTIQSILPNRSIHRRDKTKPYLEVFWSAESSNANNPNQKHYYLKSVFIAPWVFDRFNRQFHLDHQLPDTVTFRYEPDKSTTREKLSEQIEGFVKELLSVRKKSTRAFSHFKVLKDSDFNYKQGCGIIIAKFKHYPFVIKLVRETPKTFVSPFSKGIIPSLFFTIGGGSNRFLTGLTRIPNLYQIQEMINADPYWSKIVSAPRKWFWIPPNVKWFTIRGYNLSTDGVRSADFPSIYAIVCDEIIAERTLSISNKKDRKLALKFTNFLGNRLDPHICNYMVEAGTGKLVFIDTEHFATVVGLREPLVFESYARWYIKLANHYVKHALFRDKKKRREEQYGPTPPALKIF